MNKNKRASLRKEFLESYKAKDYLASIDNLENILKLYNEEEKETIEYCTDLYNLAYIQQMLGKFSLSINYYKKLLKILDKKEYDVNNKEDIERIDFIVSIENCLGVCYGKSSIKQTFSINCFERALNLTKKYLMNKDLKDKDLYTERFLNTLHNIGSSYYDIGQYEDAIYYFLEELSNRSSQGNIERVDNLNYLGYCYEKLKKYDDAIGYFKQALDIIKVLFSLTSEEYIANVYYIASVYSKMGDYDKAIKNYEIACNLLEQKLDKKHPYVAEAFSKLSDNYLKADRAQDALDIQLKSLNIVKETVGEKHMFYASALKRTGDIYYILGNYEKALFYYETENSIKEEIIGIYNEEFVNSLLNLINVYVKTNKKDKEEEAKNKLLKMVDFDLPKKSYEKALLVLCKIYITNDLAKELYDIYENYKYVNDTDSFDDMIKKAKDIEEDIIEKNKTLDNIYEEEEEIDELEDFREDIFDGIKNLFDGIKEEIDKMERKQKKEENKEDNHQEKEDNDEEKEDNI